VLGLGLVSGCVGFGFWLGLGLIGFDWVEFGWVRFDLGRVSAWVRLWFVLGLDLG